MAQEKDMNIDPEMLEMFRSECKDNFEQAEESLLALEDNKEDAELLNTLFRALHTLKGVSNMMGFEEMGHLAHKAEELAGIFRDEGVPVTQEGIDAILKAVDLLKDMADEAVNEMKNPSIPDEEIISEIEGLCQDLRNKGEHENLKNEIKQTVENELGESEDNHQTPEKEMAQKEDSPDHEIKEELTSETEDALEENQDSSNENLEAFLFFIEEELPSLKKHLDKALDDGDFKEVIQKIGVLEFAASDLGFNEISNLFRDFKEIIEKGDEEADEILSFFRKIEEKAERIKKGGEKEEGLRESDGLKASESFNDLIDQGREEDTSEIEEENSAFEESNEESNDLGLQDEFFANDTEIEIDDEDLLAFLVFLEEEYPRLQKAMSEALQEDKWDEVKKSADIIEYAASQLELSNLSETLRAIKELGESKDENKSTAIVELEKELIEELLALKQLGEKRGIHAGPSEKDLSAIFVNRVITDAEAMNGRLKECSDAIEDSFTLIRQGMDVEIDDLFYKEASESLRLLYHFCIFYEMDMAGEAILLLEDIYNRMAQGEIAPDPKISQITSELVLLMQDVFDAIRNDGNALDENFKDILEQLRIFVKGLPENEVTGISKEFLNLLDVSPGFYEVATPESNAKIADAFKKGLFFYEIRVDLDSNPEVAGPFMELSDRIEFITNETIYEGDRTEYNFLVASKLTEGEINEVLEDIFKDTSLFSVRRCKPRDEKEIEDEKGKADSDIKEGFKTLKRQGPSFDEELLERTGKCVEDVSAVSSTVHHVVNVLEQIDFEELLNNLLTGSKVSVHEKKLVGELILQLRNLIQADRHLVTALEELQKNIGELVTVSTLEFLEWAGLKIRNISGAKGIQVAIKIHDNNTRISRGLLKELKMPFKVLCSKLIEASGTNENKTSIELSSRYAGDSTIIELFINRELEEDVREGAIKKANEFIKDRSFSIKGEKYGFSIRIANCNAIVHGMVMQKSGVNYVVPVNSIKRILEPSRDDITFTSCDDGYKILRMEDELVSVRPILGHKSNGNNGNKELLVVVESHSGLVAYEVDEIIGQEQLRVVPLSGHLGTISGATGCTILGNGDVGIVLDVG